MLLWCRESCRSSVRQIGTKALPMESLSHPTKMMDDRSLSHSSIRKGVPMHPIRPGQPLHEGVSNFLEGTHYNFTAGGHSLIVSVRDVDSYVSAVTSGDATLGLALRDQAIFVLSRFGRLPWRAAHYNWWINPPIMRPDPWADPHLFDERGSVGVVLVDAESGMVHAVRSVHPPEEFTQLLFYEVMVQIRSRFDPWRYLEVVGEAIQPQSDGSGLIKDAICIVSCDLESSIQGQSPSSSNLLLWG